MKSGVSAMSDGDDKEQEMEWQAESDVRTLVDAEKIRADKPRLKRAMAKRKEMLAELNKVGEK